MPPFGLRSRNLAIGESGRDGSISSILAAPSSTWARRTPCSALTMRAPTLSPYLSWSCRAAASRSGTAIETWLSPVTMNKPLNDLRLAQFGDDLVVEAKLAGKDFVAVLAERRRRAPHGAGGIRELERNAETLS